MKLPDTAAKFLSESFRDALESQSIQSARDAWYDLTPGVFKHAHVNFQRSLAVIIYSSIYERGKRDVHLEYSRAFFDVDVTYLLKGRSCIYS